MLKKNIESVKMLIGTIQQLMNAIQITQRNYCFKDFACFNPRLFKKVLTRKNLQSNDHEIFTKFLQRSTLNKF